MMIYGDWEPVIGLEIHVQLNTKSKLFSKEPNRYGDEPNTNIGFLDTGQPGALPVINKEAVKKAINFAIAVGAKINLKSYFDRKSYFYPDLPLNYQITQHHIPIMSGGKIALSIGGENCTFMIEHAHLENDAGKLLHFPEFSGVDYNRSGVPLLEIVTTPCLHSPKQASSCAEEVKMIMEYINASECNMQEGHLRMDVNVSVRKRGSKKLSNKSEIKNLNSFSFMESAIHLEILRQIEFYHINPDKEINSETLRFDPDKKLLISMRKKESATDYRYIHDPNIPPLIIEKSFVDSLRKVLPELPKDRLQRYRAKLKLSHFSASLFVKERELAEEFEKGIKVAINPISLSNWISVEFNGRLKDKGTTFKELGISGRDVAKLVNLLEKGTITGTIAKKIADNMIEHPDKVIEEIIAENPAYRPIDESTIRKLVEETLQKNPTVIKEFQQGNKKVLQYLIGQVMSASKGRAIPSVVSKMIQERIK